MTSALDRRAFATHLINLDSDTARLAAMTEQLQGLGLPFERFSAIRGDALPTWLRPYFLTADGSKASRLSNGEIGCYASHLEIMRQVAQGDQTALVLEDDLQLAPNFPTLLDELLAVPQTWDILRLSSQNSSPKISLLTLPSGYSLVHYLRVPTGTGAYLIRPSGARKFLAVPQPRRRPVDQDLRRVWECDLRTLLVHPLPVAQNIGTSSIGARGKPHLRYDKGLTAVQKMRRAIYNMREIGLRRMISAYAGGIA